MLSCEECGKECPTRSCYWVALIQDGEDIAAEPCCGVECGRKRRDRHREVSPDDRWTLFDPHHQGVP